MSEQERYFVLAFLFFVVVGIGVLLTIGEAVKDLAKQVYILNKTLTKGVEGIDVMASAVKIGSQPPPPPTSGTLWSSGPAPLGFHPSRIDQYGE